MTKDRINVGVAHLNSQLGFEDPMGVDSVGISHLQEYFRDMFPEKLPQEERLQILSGSLLDAMAALSTDDELPELSATDPLGWLPHWLLLAEPVVYHTKRIGKYIGRQLIALGADRRPAEEKMARDFPHMLGLHDVSSFVIATEMALDHPRFKSAPNLLEHTRQAMPFNHRFTDEVSQARRETMELYSILPMIPAAQRRRLVNLRHDGQKIVDDTEVFIAKTRAITAPNQETDSETTP